MTNADKTAHIDNLKAMREVALAKGDTRRAFYLAKSIVKYSRRAV